jgi:hypothetical protein
MSFGGVCQLATGIGLVVSGWIDGFRRAAQTITVHPASKSSVSPSLHKMRSEKAFVDWLHKVASEVPTECKGANARSSSAEQSSCCELECLRESAMIVVLTCFKDERHPST